MSSKDKSESLLRLVENLLSLAKQIVSTKADYMLVIEEYAQGLTLLESQLPELTINPGLAVKLTQLESSHLEVMTKVALDKEKIRAQLGSLKKKGKVVITYTDQLPKRISLSTTKKV